MKKVISWLFAVLVFAGCQSYSPSWDWPEEGTIVEQAFDVPRVGRYWVTGTIKDVEINNDYLYWFKIQPPEGAGDTAWVQVDANTWKAYEVGDYWVKIPEARVHYERVKATDRGPDPKRTLSSPKQLPRPK